MFGGDPQKLRRCAKMCHRLSIPNDLPITQILYVSDIREHRPLLGHCSAIPPSPALDCLPTSVFLLKLSCRRDDEIIPASGEFLLFFSFFLPSGAPSSS